MNLRIGRIQSKLIPETEPSGLEPEERISFISSTGGQDSSSVGPSGLARQQPLVTRGGSVSVRTSSGQQDQRQETTTTIKQPKQAANKKGAELVRNKQQSSSVRYHQENPRKSTASEDSRLIEEAGESFSSRSLYSWCCCCFVRPNNMTKAASLIMACFVAELIGTFLLVVIGDGTIATYVLTKQPVNVFVACFAFGVGCMIASFATSKISGAHINPAVSLAYALDGQLKWSLLPVYISAQYLGAFLAALVIFINNVEAINALDDGLRSAFGSSNSTGHIFATYPSEWVSVWGSLLDQILGTAVLLFSLSAVGDKQNLALDDKHQPFIVALVIGLVSIAFNPNCGAIFNPARDLAPRILTALVGYPSVWSPTKGLYWLTAGVLGPHIGAILGLFCYRVLVGGALAAKRKHDQEAENLEMKQQQQNQHGLLSKLTGGRHSSKDMTAASAELGGSGYGSAAARHQQGGS